MAKRSGGKRPGEALIEQRDRFEKTTPAVARTYREFLKSYHRYLKTREEIGRAEEGPTKTARH